MSQPLFYDRVMETSTTTGTGTYTLAGAVTGYQSFAVVGNGGTCYYSAWEVNAGGTPSGDWETGLGTYTTAGTTLARTTILSSSNSNAAVNWSAGTRRIALSYPAGRAVATDALGTTADAPTFTSLEVKGNARFKGPGPYVDVMSSGLTRKCAASLTTTTGTITGGTNSMTVASATGWQVGHGIAYITDASTLATSYVTAISGTTFTLNDNAPSTATAKTVYHDDTLAIQDAIDFGSSLTSVYIPGGQYYITSIKLRSGVAVYGADVASTSLISLPGNTASGMVMLTTTTTSNARLRNLTLNGNKSASPAPTCAGLYVNNTGAANRRHFFSDLRITATVGDGLKCEGVYYSHFRDIIIDTVDGNGLSENNNCFFNHYASIEINTVGLHGVSMFGLADLFTNLLSVAPGQINSASDCLYLGDGAHGHNFHGFWLGEGKRACLHIDSNTGGQSQFNGSTHQNLSAEHVRMTSGQSCNLRINTVAGDTRAATSLLNMAGGTRHNIEITYISTSNVLLANTAPATGTALQGSDNYIRIFDGHKLGAGDINVFECEPLYVTQDWTRTSPSALWRYPGGIVYRQAG